MSMIRTQSDQMRGLASGSLGNSALCIPAAALSVVVFAALLHPHPLVLPILGAVLVVAGFVLAGAIMLLQRKSQSPASERLLLPALIVFFGFAATILADGDLMFKA